MKSIFVFLAMSITATAAYAQDTYVNGYTRSDGTYVAPHYRSAPNTTKSDNWTQRGNENPYTGKNGTLDCGMNCNNYGNNGSRSTLGGSNSGSRSTLGGSNNGFLRN